MVRKNLFQNFLSVKEIKMGQIHCKECRNAKNKAYREANKDKVKHVPLLIYLILQQKECFCYKNLQPLWAIDNLKKAYKYENSKSV